MTQHIDPHVRDMLDAAAAMNLPRLETLPPPQAREMFRAMRNPADTGPQTVSARDLQVDGAAGKVGARLYTPEGATSTGPGVIYFHGGGWVIGDLDTHDAFCRRLAEQSGARVLSVDYRLAPENPFPASHDDCLAATRWAFDHAGEIGFDPRAIAVAGDSAGGNLAASVAIDLKSDPQRRLKFQALFYPVASTTTDTPSYESLAEGHFLTRSGMQWFIGALGPAAAGHPRVHLLKAEDLSGLPPAYVTTAGFDPLKDEGAAFAQALEAAGVKVEHREYGGFIHGFYAMPMAVPAVEGAITDAAQAIAAGLGG